MTDERIDALIRRLDVPYVPDPTFVDLTLAVLAPRVTRARRRDERALSRWWTALWSARASAGRNAIPMARPALILAVVAFLVLALVVTLVLSGAFRRQEFGGNGPLVVSRGGELLTIDAETSVVRTTVHESTPIVGLTRSPDGRLMAFWTGPGTGTRFEVANVDGSDRRQLAPALGLVRGGCIEDWAPDSKSIATEVTDQDRFRIVVADVATGNASFLTPPGVIAECPLWSPDGRTIAFQHDFPDGHTTLAMIGRDGSGMRELSGGVGSLLVFGSNGWSPDGTLIYFGAGDSGTTAIFRANVKTGATERLTSPFIHAFAPMVSPDGTHVSFIVWGAGYWDLHIMRFGWDGRASPPRIRNERRLEPGREVRPRRVASTVPRSTERRAHPGHARRQGAASGAPVRLGVPAEPGQRHASVSRRYGLGRAKALTTE